MDITEIMRRMESGIDEFKGSYGSRMAEVEASLRHLEKKANRPGAEAYNDNPDSAEHKSAYGKFLRKGLDAGLGDLEAKAMNITTSADGGYALPEEIDRTVDELLRNRSSIRSIAQVVKVGSQDYKKLVSVHGAVATWVGETSSRPETDTPQLAEVAPPIGELYANPAVTQRALDDVFFNVESWLAGELAQQFGLAEGTAFVSGDGTNKPKGFLAGTINTSTDGARTFGHLQMIKTGVAGDFVATTSSTNPVDTLIKTIYSLTPEYRSNAWWTMNSTTLERIRTFKDADGNYIWRPGAEQGAPSLLLGHPVLECPDMGDVATNTYPIAFGDFSKGYLIADRIGTRVLRDPYTNKPYVHFYTTKRVGGALLDSNAIRVIATRT